jgi:hypothetical protein
VNLLLLLNRPRAGKLKENKVKRAIQTMSHRVVRQLTPLLLLLLNRPVQAS